MKRLIDRIESRNRTLSEDLKSLQKELQSVFQEKILSAGVLQPGYFNDFYPILEKYKSYSVISRYMVTEEEHTNDGQLYKVPVIDVIKTNEQSSSRIFLLPF